MTANLPVRRVPDIGETFEHEGRSYRVTCWLRTAPPPRPRPGRKTWVDAILWETAQMSGPRADRLMFCLREHAEYVEGAGVCGVTVPVEDVVVTGRVPWTAESIEEDRRFAIAIAGRLCD